MSGTDANVSDVPLVSVVIPTFNQARWLGEAIDSALAQTYAPLEVVVVDNGSTDSTPRVIAEYGDRIRSVHQDNRGPSSARNLGVQTANGEYVVFLDGDDVLHATCAERRVALLRESGAAIAVGAFHIVRADRQRLWQEGLPLGEGPVSTATMCVTMYGPTCGMTVHKGSHEQVGGFDEGFRIAEDSDYAIRLTAHGGAVYDPEPLAEYRQAGASLSRNYVLLYDSYRKMAKKNEGVLGDRAQYWHKVGPALRARFADVIFGKLLKEGRASAIPIMIRFLCMRPSAFSVFAFWIGRAVRKRVPGRKVNPSL